jgi:CopG family nickel-responsive transcriptional regulator
MHRLTISLDDLLADRLDKWMRDRGYGNRSEAFRDILRKILEEERVETSTTGYCVGCLSFIYNHHERQLASRLAEMQHGHHELTICSTHIHLDHEACMETTLLKGSLTAVLSLSKSIMAEKGVRHGKLNLVPVEVDGSIVPRSQTSPANGPHTGHSHIHPYS